MYKRQGSYLTIEKSEGGTVPVVIWEVTATDDAALDRYEGFQMCIRDSPLGGLLSGITPVWASEIEPFPIRVTTKPVSYTHLDVYKRQ